MEDEDDPGIVAPTDPKLIEAYGVAIAAIIILALIWSIGTATGAWAHQVPGHDRNISYPPSCCNSAATSPTGDCAPLDDRYVTEGAEGYEINLPVGSHPKLKTKAFHAVIPYRARSIREPIDQQYHLCISSEPSNYVYCFFPKPGSV